MLNKSMIILVRHEGIQSAVGRVIFAGLDFNRNGPDVAAIQNAAQDADVVQIQLQQVFSTRTRSAERPGSRSPEHSAR